MFNNSLHHLRHYSGAIPIDARYTNSYAIDDFGIFIFTLF